MTPGKTTDRLRDDPLRPWLAQRLVARAEQDETLVVAARQTGKTTVAAAEVLRAAFARPKTTSCVLAPTKQFLRRAVDKLLELAARLPGVQWREQKGRFELDNGSTIECVSAESAGGEATRGLTIHGGLWIDEAALVPEHAVKAARGCLLVGRGRVLVTTTPVGRNWVWREWNRTDADACVARFRFRAGDSPFMDAVRLARERAELSPEVAAQELDAEFVDDLTIAFPDTSRLFVPTLPDRSKEPRSALRNVLGIDLGQKQDWLVITLMNMYGEAAVLERVQGLDWTDAKHMIADLAVAHDALVVLDDGPGGGAGAVLESDLRRERNVRTRLVHTAVPARKAEIVEQTRLDVRCAGRGSGYPAQGCGTARTTGGVQVGYPTQGCGTAWTWPRRRAFPMASATLPWQDGSRSVFGRARAAPAWLPRLAVAGPDASVLDDGPVVAHRPRMSLPRRLVPGRTHAVVRRTARRCFFLVPTKWVRQLVLYVLGLALLRFPHVKLHALMAESNHIHFVLTDDTPAHEPSELPEFFGLLHSLIARALNARYGRGENLFKTGSYDNVEIHGDVSLERQLVYLWTNPVKDGLVARPELWPGARTLPADFGTTTEVDKPDGAFFGGRRPGHLEQKVAARRRAAESRASKPAGTALAERFLELEREEREAQVLERDMRREKKRAEAVAKREAVEGPRPSPRKARKRKERAPRPPRDRSALPDQVTVRIDPPPGYSHLGLEGTRARFARLTEEAVVLIHRERELLGQTRFLGIKAVLLQDPRESAGDTFPTFARNPRIACSGVGPRLDALRGLQAWRREVGEKREAWVGGDRDVVFPAGVYGLWRFHGARVVGARPRARIASPSAPGTVATPVTASAEARARPG